jgi:hypothetical protein
MQRTTALAWLVFVLRACTPCISQANPDLPTYFKKYVGLSYEQIQSIRGGKAYAKTIRPRTPSEVFVFGAVYVNAVAEDYVKLAQDFDRLRNVSGFLAIRRFSSPPQPSDFEGFSFDPQDIDALKKCKPGDCDVQLPASYMDDFRKTIDWSSPTVADQVNKALREAGLEKLTAYQRDGNRALDVYHDKQHPVDVAEQFKYMISYSKALPEYLPDFYDYLLTYPNGKPGKTEDSFYWAKVKFGLKPTLRVVHVITTQKPAKDGTAYFIAEKQLYASHYFETALDLTSCIPDSPDSKGKGFYLIKVMGSEQAGLTGVKGSVVRKAAVDRSVSSLQKSLTSIKDGLEHGQ